MEEFAASAEHPQKGNLSGNLYGVLLAQAKSGELVTLKGFSGLWDGESQRLGWVPPLKAHVRMALAESHVLATLANIKQELITLSEIPERAAQDEISQRYDAQLQQLGVRHRQRKQQRDRDRRLYHEQLVGDALAVALNNLNRESQWDGTERRHLKQEREQAIQSLAPIIAQANRQIQTLKLKYKTLSKAWQSQMQTAYFAALSSYEQASYEQPSCEQANCEQSQCSETLAINFSQNIFPQERCGQRAAAKLLHYAIVQQLTPLALAEFWWGESQGDYVSGQFYGATAEECTLLMKLCALETPPILTEAIAPLPIVYQDEHLIVVDKPAGLLSVPGRRYHLQDSVLGRLRHQLPNLSFLQAVHRLDRDTSGLLAIAASADIHRALSQQFAQRQVHKTYEAILSGPLSGPFSSLRSSPAEKAVGTVELPLRAHPEARPKQIVDFQQGKLSRTEFRLLTSGEFPKVELVPHTGRTHQLRMHAAHPKGLNAPILGDVLYSGGPKSKRPKSERLHLHATELAFVHPVTKAPLCFKSLAPF